MAVCRLSAQKSPHAQASREGNITGTPARPHASFWRQTDLPHSLHASTPRPAFCTALPQSQTLKYLHDMRIILRLIRRCSACLAEELYWMCVNSGQDFSLVDATRATVEDNLPSTTPTSTIQHIARAVLFAQCEEMFFRLFYDDLASSFAPHQSKICSEATVRSLIHSAELLDGVCVRAIETHFEDQCSVIATTSCLKHIGFSCKAAQLLGLDIDTIVSDGIGAGVLSNSCQIFIETLNLRGRVSMNDGIACLLQYIVKDMATHDTAEANVGTDEMVRELAVARITRRIPKRYMTTNVDACMFAIIGVASFRALSLLSWRCHKPGMERSYCSSSKFCLCSTTSTPTITPTLDWRARVVTVCVPTRSRLFTLPLSGLSTQAARKLVIDCCQNRKRGKLSFTGIVLPSMVLCHGAVHLWLYYIKAHSKGINNLSEIV